MRVLIAAFTLAALPSAAFAASPIQPGQWEVRSQVTAVDMPGAPPQMLEMMKRPHVIRHCVTPEQAKKGPQDMLKQHNGDCKFTRYSMAGGNLDAQMQCTSPGRGSMTVTTKGHYVPGKYDSVSNMVMSGPRGEMKMTSVGQGRRVGPCAK